MHSIYYYTLQLSIWSVIIPLLLGFAFFKKLDKKSKTIFFLVLVATIPQVLTAFIVQSEFLNSLYNIYTPVEFTIVYSFVAKSLSISLFKKIRTIMLIVFACFSFFIIGKYGLQKRFLNEWVCIANVCYIGWIFLYILECLIKNIDLLNPNLPMFWYLAGLILYTPCTALVFSFYYYIGKNALIKNLWVIHDIFNTILYIFFAIGLYKSYRESILTKVNVISSIKE